MQKFINKYIKDKSFLYTHKEMALRKYKLEDTGDMLIGKIYRYNLNDNDIFTVIVERRENIAYIIAGIDTIKIKLMDYEDIKDIEDNIIFSTINLQKDEKVNSKFLMFLTALFLTLKRGNIYELSV